MRAFFKARLCGLEDGAGTVEGWDKGEFDLEKKTTDQLEFTLRGEKLSGGCLDSYQ